ncbi:MAG: 50S ribosomal protein L3 [Planctomycetes bacterium]|nr:50S ribosomal protein L3 [Planctomycetota bacterium]
MTKYILGRKRGMTQLFAEDGECVPVTVIEAGPCFVTQVRTKERDGYEAIQLGFEAAKEKHLRKPQLANFKKLKMDPLRHLRETRLRGGEAPPEVGTEVKVDVFEIGDHVDVIGTTKGKGFQGTIRRHGFHRGPESHGSMNVRQPGSIGCSAFPSRVMKGMRMAGQMGAKRHTQKNLMVVLIDTDRNLLFVRGAIPGPNGGFVEVCKAKTFLPKEKMTIPKLAAVLESASGEAAGEES